MNQITNNRRTVIHWSLAEQLEHLDFTDDIALLAHTNRCRTNHTHEEQLKINTSKTKVIRINNKNNATIITDHNQLEEVDSFTYLGSIMTVDEQRTMSRPE